jgi:uroporphyrinogen-III synthase
MRLIITRPEEDAAPLAEKLSAMGHEAVAMPLLAIEPVPGLKLQEKPYQAICVTSANALRCITPPEWMLQIPVLTVGPQSLQAAETLGFTQASAHGGDVRGLAAHITRNLKVASGPVLYLAGDQVSADLQGLLVAKGFEVDKLVAYAAVPRTPVGLEAGLARADGVLLYSPRTAKLFAALVQDHKLEGLMKQVICFCLSPNVAIALPRPWTCRVAKQANETGMLALLDRQAQNR